MCERDGHTHRIEIVETILGYQFLLILYPYKVILAGQDAQHVILPLEGGSDNGEFPIIGQKLKSYKVVLKSGKLHEGDVIVEVQVTEIIYIFVY